jgi:hypothetical protein
MTAGHPFWWLVMVACLVWYSTITIYVAIRGVFDIKHMLRKLASEQTPPDDDAPR